MIDITEKSTTNRSATAAATVRVGQEIANLIAENTLKKGDVLTIAQIAGIVGAKKTAEIIPLCHNIPLNSIKVVAKLDSRTKDVNIVATVNCQGKTGVEMEALTAVSVAALTVYDMCKSVSKNITITDVHLLSKSGGESGDYVFEEIVVRDYEKSPLDKPKVFLGGV